MNNKYNSISPFLQTPLQPNNVIIYKAPSKLSHVPAESVSAYKAASVWSNYKNRIQAIQTN